MSHGSIDKPEPSPTPECANCGDLAKRDPTHTFCPQCSPEAQPQPTGKEPLSAREWCIKVCGADYAQKDGGPKILDMMEHYALHRLARAEQSAPVPSQPSGEPKYSVASELEADEWDAEFRKKEREAGR